MYYYSIKNEFLKTRIMLVEHLKVGNKYRNATRHQVVEVTQIVGRLVWYRILEQDTNIVRKEPSKTVEHFTNSYVKS